MTNILRFFGTLCCIALRVNFLIISNREIVIGATFPLSAVTVVVTQRPHYADQAKTERTLVVLGVSSTVVCYRNLDKEHISLEKNVLH